MRTVSKASFVELVLLHYLCLRLNSAAAMKVICALLLYFVLTNKIFKNKTTTQWQERRSTRATVAKPGKIIKQYSNIRCSWGKAIVFPPKQGDISLRVCLGFRQEIPASDNLRLIIDGSNYLFIHLSSLFSFPRSACSAFKVRKRGQLGKKARRSVI